MRQMKRSDLEDRYLPFISKTTLDRLVSKKYEGRFEPATIKKLQFLSEATDQNAYSSITQRILQTVDDTEHFSKLLGEYTYFRYRSHGGAVQYHSGRLRMLYASGGIPAFQHWPDSNNVEPLNSGFVFICASTVFMLGFREKGMRLAIAKIAGEGRLHGLVVSEHPIGRTPFAARFVLVPNSDERTIRRFADETTRNETRNGRPVTNGEAAFANELGGGTAFISLS